MLDCIGVLIPFVLIGAVIYVLVKAKENADMERSRQRARELEERHRKEDEEMARIQAREEATAIIKYVADVENQYRKDIFDFFTSMEDPYIVLSNCLSEHYTELCKAQADIKKLDSSKNFDYQISKLNELRGKLDAHANTTHLTLFHQYEETYGLAYTPTMEEINKLDRTTALERLNAAKELLNAPGANNFLSRIDEFFAINPYDLICCIWFFAMVKPYSASDFKLSLDIYNRIFRETIQDSPDIFAAQLYAKKEMAGEDAVLNDIRDTLKDGSWHPVTLQVLASAMMWMQCYKAEEYILNYKLNNSMEMTQKEQERLHALANGGGNGPQIHTTNSDGYVFDISPLTWNDDIYTSFFDNLNFQGNVLPYSLAVRDSDNDLLVPNGIKVPTDSQLLERLKLVFAEEYENTANISMVNCVAVSDAGEEVYIGYLAQSSDCPQMAIMVRVVKIGKHINIKFYTLFVPQNSSAGEELKKALALKNNLALTVNIWEKGLKDTILLAVQQLLNKVPETVPVDSPVDGPSTQSDGEPIF